MFRDAKTKLLVHVIVTTKQVDLKKSHLNIEKIEDGYLIIWKIVQIVILIPMNKQQKGTRRMKMRCLSIPIVNIENIDHVEKAKSTERIHIS